MGGVDRHPAVSRAGRGGHRDRLRQQPDPVHPHRHREVARRDRRALQRTGRRTAQLLHGTDQGTREREVLRAGRRVRGRERRDGHGRLRGQRRRAHHLLHGRDPREPLAAPGRRCRRRPGRDGRVPLLRRPRPRVGVAGTTARLAAGAVRPDVGDPRRCHRARGGPHPSHGPRDGDGHRRRAPCAPALLLRDDPDPRDDRRPAEHRAGADLHRALLAGGRDGAGPGAVEHQGCHPRAARRDRGADRPVPFHDRVRQDPLPLSARRDRGASRGDAAEVPPPGRTSSPSADCCA